MTIEEAIKILKSKLDGSVDTSWEWTESVRMAIEALEMQDLCAEMLESAKDTNALAKDLISRQDAIDALGEEPEIWNDTEEEWAYRNAWVEHISAIKSLPSADRPTGEWVEKDGECVCSECGNSVSFSRTKYGWVLGKFCQTCGARMYKGNVQRR